MVLEEQADNDALADTANCPSAYDAEHSKNDSDTKSRLK